MQPYVSGIGKYIKTKVLPPVNIILSFSKPHSHSFAEAPLSFLIPHSFGTTRHSFIFYFNFTACYFNTNYKPSASASTRTTSTITSTTTTNINIIIIITTMRVASTAILVSALAAVASALHGFSCDAHHPPPAWFNFQHDDDFVLTREHEAFFAFKHPDHHRKGLVPCFELHNPHDDQLVYATAGSGDVSHFEHKGFRKTGVEFFLFDHQRAHTVPLLRTATKEGQFLFTTNFDEARNNHYFVEELVGFVFPRRMRGAEPVRRWLLLPEH